MQKPKKAVARGKKPAAAKKMGRPPFVPTIEHREKVEILIAGGQSEDDIARVIGISRMTLRAHFADELATGRAKKRAEILMAQYRTALAGNASAQEKFLKKGDLPAFQPQAEKPKVEKLGKKEQALRDANTPNLGTTLGDLMAQRLRPN